MAPVPPPYPPPPPGWTPYPRVLVPSRAEIDALEASGRHKKRVGAIVIGAGSALAVAGAGLMIAGAWDAGDHCHYNRRDGSYDYDGYAYDHAYYGFCGNTSLYIAGATTSIVAAGTLVPGIIMYVSGGGDVDEAQRWRARCSRLCWRPAVERNGGGVQLELQR